jgi:ABC-type antimicrobial peptide transport system permease subunit
VLVLILSRVLVLVGAGIGIGALASTWVSRFAAALLFEVSPHDPVAFTGAVAVLAVVATSAAFLPARRASRIDPAEVLRES